MRKNIFSLCLVFCMVLCTINYKTVTVNGSGSETENDIVFYLPHAANAGVSCVPLKSSFAFAMREKPDDKTIRLYESCVAVFVGASKTPENQVNMAEAIEYIAKQ